MMRAPLVAALLLASPALAASAWAVTSASGASVMEEISPVSFTVKNNSTAGEALTTLTLQLNVPDYDIDGAVAPVGWQVSSVDRLNRKVIFTANGSACPRGIAAGGSAVFTLRILGKSAGVDQTAESLVVNGGKTTAQFQCAPSSPTVALKASPLWKRIGVGAWLQVVPTSVSPGDVVTLTLHVTNRSTASATLTPVGLPLISDAATGNPAPGSAFTLQSGPSPASLTLPVDGTGNFIWTYLVNSTGVFRFSASAHNAANTLTSQVVTAQDLAVGQFPGTVSIAPDQVISGGQTRVTLTLRNNSDVQFLNIVPSTPTVTGNVTATLSSGPFPDHQTSLPPGSATSFSYYFTLTGGPGATFQVTAGASATKSGVAILADPVSAASGQITTHTVTANPIAVLSAGGAVTVEYTVFNGGSQDVKSIGLLDPDAHFVPATNPWAGDTSGWTPGAHNNPLRKWPISSPSTAANLHNTAGANTKKFSFTYSSISAVTATTTFSHRFELVQADDTTVRIETSVSIFLPRTVPPSSAFTAVATNGKVGLAWTNPLDHDGALVLRSATAIPNTLPVNGRRYDVGNTLGNATVIHSSAGSYASSQADTGLTNGTKLFYKVFNKDSYNLYSSGDVPTSAGLFAIPTPGAPTGPAWCYSVGVLTPQQPFTDFGKGVYTSSNARAFTGNSISTDPSLDGTERWRPAVTTGITQARPTVGPLQGKSGTYLVAGDQAGFTYAIDVGSGATVWVGNGGVSIGAVQAQAAIQLNQFTTGNDAGVGFRAAYPNTDVIFFGTRVASTTANRVWALSSTNGSALWSYNPGNLDIISGGMVVDYATNRLWVASRGGGGSPSIRVLDTVSRAVLASFAVGDIDNALQRNYSTGEIYAVTNGGTAYGLDVNLMTVKWSYNLGGAVSGYLVPVGGGFIASTSSGVQRYTVTQSTDGGSPAVAPTWGAQTAIPGASAARIDSSAVPYKLYVADSLGRVNRLDYATGALEASFQLSAQALGMPSIDPSTSPKRLFVGGLDGRLCAVDLPF